MSETTVRPYRKALVWGRLALTIGIGTSIGGNVQAIHLDNATPGIGAHLSAVFWPAALFILIEIMLHTPWANRAKDRLARWAGLGLVAFIAAWVSYWHLAHVLSSYGYDKLSTYLGPLAIDGMMAMATVALTRISEARGMASRASAMATDVMATRPAVQDMVAADGVKLASEAEQWLATSVWDRLASEADSTTTPAVPVAAVPVSPGPQRGPRGKLDEEAMDLIVELVNLGISVKAVDTAIATVYEVSDRTVRRARAALFPTADADDMA